MEKHAARDGEVVVGGGGGEEEEEKKEVRKRNPRLGEEQGN